MSESNKSRSIEQIQQEYQSLCLKAGHIQYQIFTLGKDLDVLNSTLRDLNLEASSVNAKAEEEKAKAASEAEAK